MSFDPDSVRAFEHAGWQLAAAEYDATFAQTSTPFVEALLDAGAPLLEDRGKEFGLCRGIFSVRDGGAHAAAARRLAVGLGVVSLVAEHRPGRDVGADVEQDREVAAVAGLPAGEMEGQRQAVEVGLQVDFGGKPAARATESLPVLPPFAPAAETWARTIVESTI